MKNYDEKERTISNQSSIERIICKDKSLLHTFSSIEESYAGNILSQKQRPKQKRNHMLTINSFNFIEKQLSFVSSKLFNSWNAESYIQWAGSG